MKNINKYIDHTLLRPDASEDEISNLCKEAVRYNFFSVCLNPTYVRFAYDQLLNTEVAVCTVIGFPLGANTTDTKIFETRNAILNGASEIDMVINVGAIKSKNWKYIEEEIFEIKKVCGDKILKVIFETCLLTNDEIIMAAQVSERAGADFIKTSTGFGSSGASVEIVKLMRKSATMKVSVKASGGVRDYKTAIEMIEAGATRLGTSSGIAILNGGSSDAKY